LVSRTKQIEMAQELTNDYLVLNPIGELSHLGKNQLAIGVRNFSLMGQPCLMEFVHNGKIYKRLHTDVIPNRLVGHICSVQVYEQVS